MTALHLSISKATGRILEFYRPCGCPMIPWGHTEDECGYKQTLIRQPDGR